MTESVTRRGNSVKPLPVLQKDFIRIFNDLSRYKERNSFFADVLELAAIFIHQVPYQVRSIEVDEPFFKLEETFRSIEKKYTEEEFKEISKLISIAMVATSFYRIDFFGKVFMLEELYNKHMGQFFTPPDVAKLMAAIVADRRDEEKKNHYQRILDEQGIITFHEPTCGAGGLIVAFADELEYMGFDPRRDAQFHCVDISRNAFNMTYFTLAVLDLQALVYHGDTLRMTMWEQRPTYNMVRYEAWKYERERRKQQEEGLRRLLQFDQEVISGNRDQKQQKPESETEQPKQPFGIPENAETIQLQSPQQEEEARKIYTPNEVQLTFF